MFTRTITACANPVWGDAAQTFILCTATFEEFSDPLPFRVEANDPEGHGQELWSAVVAGSHGPIGAYVAPPPRMASSGKPTDVSEP